ncbi:unnamed protein product [Phaeothamnion confervicola]
MELHGWGGGASSLAAARSVPFCVDSPLSAGGGVFGPIREEDEEDARALRSLRASFVKPELSESGGGGGGFVGRTRSGSDVGVRGGSDRPSLDAGSGGYPRACFWAAAAAAPAGHRFSGDAGASSSGFSDRASSGGLNGGDASGVDCGVLPHLLAKYADVYNKHGRIGIYNRAEREAILERFRHKRRRRVFRKKIRYSCRKNLADKRLRIKGRFVRMSAEQRAALELELAGGGGGVAGVGASGTGEGGGVAAPGSGGEMAGGGGRVQRRGRGVSLGSEGDRGYGDDEAGYGGGYCGYGDDDGSDRTGQGDDADGEDGGDDIDAEEPPVPGVRVRRHSIAY